MLSLDDILPNTVAAQDVFENNQAKMPLIRKGAIITAEYLYGLRRRGISEMHVKEAIVTGGSGFDASGLKKRDTSLSGMPFEKSPAAILPKAKKDIIKAQRDMHLAIGGRDKGAIEQAIDRMEEIISGIVEHMAETPNTPFNIASVQNDQEFMYHHNLSVAVIAIAISQGMGLSSHDQIQIGTCAVLHDMGKLMLSAEIQLKVPPYTEEEEAEVRTHAEIGYDSLKMWGILTEDQREAIRYHHERLDGSGYPQGLRINDIPLWAKIIAVADVYEAMTNARPPAKSASPTATLEHLLMHVGIHFDKAVVQSLYNKIEFYPMGSFVMLSNEQFALVTLTKRTLRPVVRILSTNTEVELADPKNANIKIDRVVSYREAIRRKR